MFTKECGFAYRKQRGININLLNLIGSPGPHLNIAVMETCSQTSNPILNAYVNVMTVALFRMLLLLPVTWTFINVWVSDLAL